MFKEDLRPKRKRKVSSFERQENKEKREAAIIYGYDIALRKFRLYKPKVEMLHKGGNMVFRYQWRSCSIILK